MDPSSSQTAPNPFAGVKLSPLEKAGEVLFRLRDYTPIPIVILALLFANPTPLSLVVGGLVALAGELARAYGVAFIGTISRTRSYSNGELVKSGPFSLLRNPLYFGNLVLIVGLAAMTGVAWLPLVVIAIFYAQYIPIVAWEEMKLMRIFGERYEAYKREVPNRWFPHPGRLIAGAWTREAFSWGPAWKSEKRTLTSIVSYCAFMTGLYLFNASKEDALLPLMKHVSRLFP